MLDLPRILTACIWMGSAGLFGYIKPCKPELRLREYEWYKAVYCSLCRDLGRNFGPFARLTLSYDFTFLAMLQLALSEGCPGFVTRRCAFNPLVRCHTVKDADLSLSSHAAMILLYYKLLDNLADERGLRRLPGLLARPLFAAARKKAARRYPEIDRLAARLMKEQSEAEAGEWRGIDPVCEPTARLLSELLAMPAVTDAQKRILARMGYCLGKWVYLADALDDYPRDLRSGAYNPLRSGSMTEEEVRGLMNICIGEACAAFELLELRRFSEIFENILYLGLSSVQKQIGTKEKRSSERSL